MDFPSVIAAPMAGGPSTPALVNAVQFGFIALGTCTVAQARAWLAECEPPFGANLFVPQPEPLLDDVLTVARHLGTKVPDVASDYAEKFALVLDAAPAVVSSTFGCFSEAEIAQLHAAGSEAWATVTSPAEIAEAQHRGVDGVIVQGLRAGGHRGTWSQHDEPDQRALDELLALVNGPVIAAGGVRGPEDVANLLCPLRAALRFCWRRKQAPARATANCCAQMPPLWSRGRFPDGGRAGWKPSSPAPTRTCRPPIPTCAR